MIKKKGWTIKANGDVENWFDGKIKNNMKTKKRDRRLVYNDDSYAHGNAIKIYVWSHAPEEGMKDGKIKKFDEPSDVIELELTQNHGTTSSFFAPDEAHTVAIGFLNAIHELVDWRAIRESYNK